MNSRPRFSPITQAWWDEAENGTRPYGSARLRVRGGYLISAVTNWEEPSTPREIIAGRGQLVFILANTGRGSLPTLTVQAQSGERLRWLETPEMPRQVGPRPVDKPSAESRSSFSFEVAKEGEEEVFTGASAPPTRGLASDGDSARAHSSFSCRAPAPVLQPSKPRASAPHAAERTPAGAFISYCQDDSTHAHGIATVLTTAEIGYWMDREKIPPGGSIFQHVQTGLKHYRDVILCITHRYLESTWGIAEYAAAMGDVLSGAGDRSVIPVLFEDIERSVLPVLLRDRLTLDARKSEDLKRLIEHLKR